MQNMTDIERLREAIHALEIKDYNRAYAAIGPVFRFIERMNRPDDADNRIREEVLLAFKNSNRVAACKKYRELTGASLREALDYLKSIADQSHPRVACAHTSQEETS